MRAFGLLKGDRKAVSPVIGVILMVAATIVIAAIVMGYLGSFKPPKKTLDVVASNVEVVKLKNNSKYYWYLTAVLTGADASQVNGSDVKITLLDQSNSSISANFDASGHLNNQMIKINLTSEDNCRYIKENDKIHIVITYVPTGQTLFNGIVVASKT